jgi:hypothetical protein
VGDPDDINFDDAIQRAMPIPTFEAMNFLELEEFPDHGGCASLRYPESAQPWPKMGPWTRQCMCVR